MRRLEPAKHGAALGRALALLTVGFVAACALGGDEPAPGAPPHHTDAGFRNAPAIAPAAQHEFVLDRLRLALLPNPDAAERPPARTSAEAHAAWDALGAADSVAWIGHSTVLIRLAGKTILADPVFGAYVTPAPPFGPRRLVPPGMALADLPRIDVILVSHNHYDHFEPDAIRRIAERDRPLCLFPLGVGGSEDFGCARAQRMDWGASVRHDALTLSFLPAQHDSGRGLFDRNASLWGSWLIESRRKRVYFAGDTGYGPHLARIGATYGPIDLALLPVAAYGPRSVNREVHLDPEGALRAFVDLRARRMLAIHWGTFALGTDDAFAARADVPRAAAAAGIASDRVWVFEIGEARRF